MKNKSVLCILSIMQGALLLSLMLVPASAEEVSGTWSGKVSDFCLVLQRIALTGGVVGLAWCAIEYMVGNAESARKALSKAVIILGAVAARIMFWRRLKPLSAALRPQIWTAVKPA